MTKLNSAPTMWSPGKSVFSWLLAILFGLFAMWMMVKPMVGSGVFDEKRNLLFIPGAAFSDAGVHLSLITEMLHRFPPTNFADGGVALRNYHYLYDALLAIVTKLTGLPVLDLYFRITPLVLAGLLCLVIYLTVYTLSKNRWAAAFGIFITVFSTSLGFLLPGGANNIFMTDQIFELMFNPQGVLSLIIFLTIFLLLAKYENSKNWRYLVGVTLLLGLSFGIKAYGGIVFALGAVVAIKDRRLFVFVGLGLLAMGVWVVMTIDRSVVGVRWAPLWLLWHMVIDFEHLNMTRLATVQGWPKMIIFYGGAFGVYVLGSLGLRVFGFLTVRQMRSRFLMATAASSFLIPLFFNQGRKPYDIVQFTPYFTLVMGIALTLVLSKKWWLMLVTVIVLLFMDKREIMARLQTDDYRSKQVLRLPNHTLARGNRVVISKETVRAIDFIKKNTPPGAIFLLAPTNLNNETLWFSALAERRTVYSGLFFDYQVGKDTGQMTARWQKIFSDEPEMVDFDYAFLDTDEIEKYSVIEGKYHLQRIFSDDAAVVYQKML